MIEVQISSSITKIEKQVKALEYLLRAEINEKDRRIHLEALHRLKESLKKNKKAPLVEGTLK